jgi:tetratricopeptide (TPR) repeat protein
MQQYKRRFFVTLPTAEEVRDELQRILKSSQFKNAANQSELLTIVVEKAIVGETIGEADLTPGRFSSRSTKGRANASLVRHKLAEYYKDEGKYDIVLIDLPPGASYRPMFQLNGNSEVVLSYVKGLRHRSDFTLRSLTLAQAEFSNAYQWSRKHGFALAALIETRLLISMAVSWLSVVYQPPERFRYVIDEAISEIHELRERFPERRWQADMFEGVVALFRCNWYAAKESFHYAFHTNPDEVGISLWYALYLAFSGHLPRAEKIVKRYLQLDPWDPLINLIAAAFCYACREYLLALEYNRRAFRPDGEGSDACQLLFALLQLATNQPDKAVNSFAKISTEDWTEESDLGPRAVVKLDRVPGLKILALQLCNRSDSAERLVGDLAYPDPVPNGSLQRPLFPFLGSHVSKPPSQWRPLQIAFTLMAFGKFDDAINAIKRAYAEDATPLAWWLYLPVFDALRKSERFEKLACEMAYPTMVEAVDWNTLISDLKP